jgi:hypothetical protein
MKTQKPGRWPAIDALYEREVAAILAHDATFPGDPKPTRHDWPHYRRHEESNWNAVRRQNTGKGSPVSKWMDGLRGIHLGFWLSSLAQSPDAAHLADELGATFGRRFSEADDQLAREIVGSLWLEDLTELLAFRGQGSEFGRELALEALATAQPKPPELPPKAKRASTARRP